MGGRDKGLMPFEGRALIEHVIAALSGQCQRIAINCRPEADDRYRDYALELLHDAIPDLGPLGGVLAALERDGPEWRLCVPCDTPRLPPDLVERLWAERGAASIISVDDGERRHPSVMLLRRELTGPLRDYLDGGGRKLGLWLQEMGAAYADFSDQPEAFINLNSPEELRHHE